LNGFFNIIFFVDVTSLVCQYKTHWCKGKIKHAFWLASL